MTTMQASGVTVTPHTNYGKAAGEMVPLGHSSEFDLARAGGKTPNVAAAELRAMFGDTMSVVPTMAYDLVRGPPLGRRAPPPPPPPIFGVLDFYRH